MAAAGGIRLKPKVRTVVNVEKIHRVLVDAIVRGVNETAENAYDQARKDVPVRKVFRYGRKNANSRVFAEQRIQGRQETRFMNLEEALGESLLRRRLGLPSAFTTTRSGRRAAGSQSPVRTTDFGSYRSKDRANPSIDDDERRALVKVQGRNRIGTFEDVLVKDEFGRDFRVSQAKVNEAAESDLSSRGRYELGRARGETLGGALRRSVDLQRATPGGRKIKAKVVAGNKDVDYAKYVEFGTRRSRAQPFLRPALARAREEFIPNVKAAIRGTGS